MAIEPASNHGLIVRAPRPERVTELLESYQRRFYEDFHTAMPAPDKISPGG